MYILFYCDIIELNDELNETIPLTIKIIPNSLENFLKMNSTNFTIYDELLVIIKIPSIIKTIDAITLSFMVGKFFTQLLGSPG